MPAKPGQTLAHYRIVEKIGEGGMGVVWKAVDTTLDREVAIKVLPEAFAGEVERLARFEREAKVLATLNHPNIAGIYGLHEHDGIHFLAMEMVAGEELAARVDRGPIPLAEALDIGGKIADALEAAHAAGIIHRDLKPANVKLTPDGKVKVLDFGLAKALASDPASGDPDPGMSPTMTSAGTIAGMILGTAAYMSPEQARGQPVDVRADVWAFGVVLFEMLCGKRLFDGKTVSDTLASVLKIEPDWKDLPDDTPPAVRRLLRRCLAKEPEDRLHHIADARIEIRDALSGDSPDEIKFSGTPQAQARGSRVLPWAIAALGVVIAAGALYALEHNVERLADDHANAQRLAAGLQELGLKVNPFPETNIVIFEVDQALATVQEFMGALDREGVKVSYPGEHTIRMVTHRHIDSGEIDQALSRVSNVAKQLR